MRKIFVTSYRKVIKILGTNARCIGIHKRHLVYMNLSDTLSPIVILVLDKPK